MSARPRTRRLHIDRLELDLRGLAPGHAEQAARALGPALARALGDVRGVAPAERIDAGRVAGSATESPHALADAVATRIAARLREPRS